jgi:hypothetical protein
MPPRTPAIAIIFPLTNMLEASLLVGLRLLDGAAADAELATGEPEAEEDWGDEDETAPDGDETAPDGDEAAPDELAAEADVFDDGAPLDPPKELELDATLTDPDPLALEELAEELELELETAPEKPPTEPPLGV